MKAFSWIIIIAVVIAALVFIKIKFLTDKTSENNASSAGKNSVLAVNMKVATSAELKNEFFTSGNILANESVEIKNEAQGRVVKIFFTEGASVKQGQMLLKLNDADLLAQLKKLQSSEKNADAEEARQHQLLLINGISQSEYENALNTLNGIKADIENLQSQINKTEIKAPFDGVIGLRNISVGSFLSSGTSVTTLQQINPVKIDFFIPEKYAAQISKDATITFTVEGVLDTFTAKTYAAEPVVNASTGTIKFRALCANPGGKLIPGAFAHIVVTLETIDDAILVPNQSLVAKQNQQSVFIIKNGKAISIPVTTGIRNDSTIQITSGISIGDSVITSGILAVKNGNPVKSLPSKNAVQ